MKFEIKFLSTRSGKSMTLKMEDKTYVFNIFEGFQRYCIEMKQSLNTISTIFLTNKFNVPPLSGIYLTLLDSCWDQMNIVSSFDVDFKTIHSHAISPKHAFTFKNSYFDKFLSVKIMEEADFSNFLISFEKIRGKFYPEKIPSNIPKKLYKTLISNGFLEFEDKTYDFKDYSDPETQLNETFLVFSYNNFDLIPKNLKCYFCFNYEAYKYLTNLYPDLKSDSKQEFNNLQGIFYISDNQCIEYEGFYDYQVALYEKDQRFLLPCSFKPTLLTTDLNSNLLTGDFFTYDKTKGFIINRKPVRIAEDRKSVINEVNSLALSPIIQFLGTGCAIPSKYRNVSAILYQNETSAILLDCGEDTYSQIERLYGNFEVLKKLKIIYISHSHADHMLGIAKVLKECDHHVYIIAPDDTRPFLKYFGFSESNNIESLKDDESLESNNNCFTFISTTPTKVSGMDYFRYPDDNYDSLDRFVDTKSLCEFDFKICACIHSKSSTSISIFDKSNGKTFSYSGDTIPSALFAHISMNCDLMIHEATFNIGQEVQASKTCHSIKDDAIEIFKLSNSKKLLLTHFSNRNQNNEDEETNPEVECVGDFFTYTINSD